MLAVSNEPEARKRAFSAWSLTCRKEAWERLQHEAFDAVVSDIDMPHLSGLELTRRMRALARTSQVPVILITSLNSDCDRQAGLEAGASAYLNKSAIDSGTLIRCLERLL